MNKIAQTRLAAAFAVIGLAALAGIQYITFAFPHTVAVWEAQNRVLSVGELLLVNVSNLVKQIAFLLIPVLLAGVAACIF